MSGATDFKQSSTLEHSEDFSMDAHEFLHKARNRMNNIRL